MRSLRILTTVLLILVGIVDANAQGVKVGTRFEVERLVTDDSAPTSTLVVFVPSLTYDCEYASMLTNGFYYYFDERLAFDRPEEKLRTRIILVVNDKYDEAREIGNLLGKMVIIYDDKGVLFDHFGLAKPKYKNANSTVVLLNRENEVVLIDGKYRAQGEHLKPLEAEIRKVNGLAPLAGRTTARALKVGDIAPDFQVSPHEKISDLSGGVVLLTFYPAAFSGILPRPFVIEGTDVSSVWVVDKGDAMSCSRQIRSLDVRSSPETKPVRRIAITSSTDEILTKWKGILGTTNIEYANDRNYSISTMYSAFNRKGYNNRVSVIIDKKGKIAYIDTDYSLKDEIVINNMLVDLSRK